jgi:uncharacterized metal-binding protein
MVVRQRRAGSIETCIPARRLPASLSGRIFALDGYEDTCALKKLREIGIEPDLHVVATQCGIVKNGMAERRFDEIERLVGAVLEAIRDGQQP